MQLINIDSQLAELASQSINLEVLNMVKSGKEATVYRVRDLEDGEIMALKIYKDHNLRSFKQNADYLAGLHIGSRTIRKAVEKKTQLGRNYIQSLWVDQEYHNLLKLNAAGADVPQIYAQASNSLLCEYIGGDKPAPKLAEVNLTEAQAKAVFDKVLDNIELFLRADIVHGDLSAYNMLWWQEKLYIIDFPQAADIIKNPNSWSILERDLANVCSFFAKKIPIDRNAITNRFSIYHEYMAQTA